MSEVWLTYVMFFVLVRILSPGGVVSVDIESDACRGRKNEINTVEHVQVRI